MDLIEHIIELQVTVCELDLDMNTLYQMRDYIESTQSIVVEFYS